MRQIFLIALVFLIGCKEKSIEAEKEVTYNMISYESKAWVDETDYPTIKLINEKYFEIYQQKKLKVEGKVETNPTEMFLVLNNGNKLKIDFLDNERKLIQVSRLVDIGIEAKWGNFIKAE